MSETTFTLKTEFIELFKLLKATGVCDSGGRAKLAITESQVTVDGVIETQKGRKIRPGQRVEYNGQIILVNRTNP